MLFGDVSGYRVEYERAWVKKTKSSPPPAIPPECRNRTPNGTDPPRGYRVLGGQQFPLALSGNSEPIFAPSYSVKHHRGLLRLPTACECPQHQSPGESGL